MNRSFLLQNSSDWTLRDLFFKSSTINESDSFMDQPRYLQNPQKISSRMSSAIAPSDPDAARVVSESNPKNRQLEVSKSAFHPMSGDANAPLLNPDIALDSAEAWEEDRATRFNLPLLNASFYEAVPALEFLGWEILEVRRGYAETKLPLNIHSSNQYVTHQAALQLVAADYTGGLALASLFHLAPMLGFWESTHGQGIYMWGGEATIKWFMPSCDDLICRASVPIEHWEKYIRRLNNHQQIAPTIQVDLYNGTTRVAEAQFTYWAQDMEGLSRNAFDQNKINLLYLHKIKTTTKLIAGLRALETERPAEQRLCYDDYAHTLAGKHGIILALRFNNMIPELQRIIGARTKHLDDAAQAFLREHPKGNIVNIGIGYDARFWRLAGTDQCQIYELDLPVMLAERKKLLRYDLRHNLHCVPTDLRTTSIVQALLSDPSFNHEIPTLYIWEGGSMYCRFKEIEFIFDSLTKLLGQCADSRLWLDYVSMDVICGCTNSPEINRFITIMRKMATPFIGGIQDIDLFARDHQMTVLENINHVKYLGLGAKSDHQYSFAILKRSHFSDLRP